MIVFTVLCSFFHARTGGTDTVLITLKTLSFVSLNLIGHHLALILSIQKTMMIKLSDRRGVGAGVGRLGNSV